MDYIMLYIGGGGGEEEREVEVEVECCVGFRLQKLIH